MSASVLMAVCIIAIAVGLIFYEKKRQKKIDQAYDEMQLRIRGEGAWYAFYTMVFYMAACMILEKCAGIRILSASDALFLGTVISGSVLAGYTILHDSYFGMNRSSNKGFLLLIGVMEIFCVVMLVSLAREGIFRDLTKPAEDERIVTVLCIPLFTTILGASLYRSVHKTEEDE